MFVLKRLNFSLSIVLFIAGATHLIKPGMYLKAMPPYIPYHYEIIIFTGILELIFSFSLIYRKTLKFTSRILPIYFIALLPAHIHVAQNGIEIFGVSSKFLLWLRTVFQSVFILWALKCGRIKTDE
tara:strand:+ start:155 stop:532 length:378 start_codon:yes stop_codon:yes gene_type:complete